MQKNREIGIVFPSELEKSAKDDTVEYYHPKYEDISNIDNLYEGYMSARKGKRNRKAIYLFENNLFEELIKLSNELKDGTYKPSKYRTFDIYEPKKRTIVAPAFRDSVVQHTIYMLVYDVFDRGFIHDSYGCRKGKGTHKASGRLQTFMRKHSSEEYYLQMDIQKYYYSINHEILRNSIERKIKDNNLVDLIMKFVNIKDKIGLYIGSLLSQLFGLIYMDRVDHYIKRVLKQKHYVRYVDDFIIVGISYDKAKELLDIIQKYIKKELNLTLSKFHIAKIKKGANYVGYRTWKAKKFVRKRTLYHFNKYLKKGNMEAVNSVLGHAKHSSSLKYMKKQIKGKI